MEWIATPVVIALSGIAAFYIALRSIAAHEKIAKKRASIDLLLSIQQSDHFRSSSESVSNFVNKYGVKADPNSEEGKASFEVLKEDFERCLKYILNQYEYMHRDFLLTSLPPIFQHL